MDYPRTLYSGKTEKNIGIVAALSALVRYYRWRAMKPTAFLLRISTTTTPFFFKTSLTGLVTSLHLSKNIILMMPHLRLFCNGERYVTGAQVAQAPLVAFSSARAMQLQTTRELRMQRKSGVIALLL